MNNSSGHISHKEQVLALYHQQSVEELFDDYAETFDEHLQKGLRYNVPTLLYEAWRKHVPSCEDATETTTKLVQRCLDLGCGTGLAGQVFRNDCSYLQGVDLSRGMCQQAKRKQLYDKVVHESLLSHVRKQREASFDLILSADVFMYVLDLKAVIEQVARIMSPQGWFVFSTESLEAEHPDNVCRQASERFAHKRDFVLNIAQATQSLELVSVDGVTLRMDDGKPVMGDIFVFQKCCP